MEQQLSGTGANLTNLQIELLKGLRHMATEKQIEDVRDLLRNYFAEQLDAAVERVEVERGYSAETYVGWAKQQAASKPPKPQK